MRMKTSPIDLLPLPEPKSTDYPNSWFYNNVAKHLIEDTVRLMLNGLPINLDRVHELELELDIILERVQDTIDNNIHIQAFQQAKYPYLVEELLTEIKAKMRSPTHYHKEFKASDPIHRSYYMLLFMERNAEALYDVVTPIQEVIPGVPKWSVADIKQLANNHLELKRLLNKAIKPIEKFAKEAMSRFADDKSRIYNKSYKDQIENISYTTITTPFNPASSVQKKEFFEYLQLEPLAISKDTKEASWGREQIEELLISEDDLELQKLYQAFIDHSFAAIVRNNFISAFYRYSILDDTGQHRLHGNYRLLGAKTGRYTSDKP